MRDALVFLGCWFGMGILAAAAFSRYKRRRPYLAARFDETAGDWADGTPAATSPADLDALELLWDLPAYSGDDHTTTNPTGD